MQLVNTDTVTAVPQPNYNVDNPIWQLAGVVERVELAAERENYLVDSVQHLFPVTFVDLYGPSDNAPLDATQQENKNDFQKQNIREFRLGDAQLSRGWATAGNWTGPFLRLSYRGGPDTRLAQAVGGSLGPVMRVWVRVGDSMVFAPLRVPYNERSDRYEIEIWGYDGSDDLRDLLDEKGRQAVDRGGLIADPGLIRGKFADFQIETLQARAGGGDTSSLRLATLNTDHAMHPLLPLHIQLAWANEQLSVWDSQNGADYHYEFSMLFRGWNNFISGGVSPNPHGGVGFLVFRNLLSNYFDHNRPEDLGRDLAPWNQNAFRQKQPGGGSEPFFAVEYMDLHILKPTCGIGIHRHRDNQEVFLMLKGHGLMVVGDWAKMDQRDRCLETRSLREGDMAICKTGQLHALLNTTDEDVHLFMFGGYD